MSDGLNRVELLGNLCADPELRYTQGGQAVLNIRLATNESYLDKNQQRVEKVEYHSLTLWGKRGEALSKVLALAKGCGVFVEGSLHSSSYDGKDGVKRYKTEVNVRNLIITSGPKGAPRGEERQPREQAPRSAPAPETDGGFPDDDSGIPF